MQINFFARNRIKWNHDSESIKRIVDGNESLGKVTHIGLFLLLFIGMFDGFLERIFSTFFISSISFVISFTLIFCGKYKQRKGWISLLCLYIGVTLVSYMYFLSNFHYDLTTSVKNSVIMVINATRNIFLFSYFFDKKVDRKTVRIIEFFFLLEVIMYIIFLIYRGKGGAFEQFLVELRLIRDWQGRFQGTFAEPMMMGFYLGIVLFFVLIYFNSKWKYLLSIVLIYVLFTACKAKFALIAVPFALMITFLTEKRSIINMSKYFFIALMAAFIIMVFIAWVNPLFIFGTIAENFGSNQSFGDRFYFLVASLRQVILYPLGTGYGLNFEYYYKTVGSLLPILEKSGMDSIEIRDAMIIGQQIGMNGKETISHIINVYGLPGIISYFWIFSKYYGMNVRCKKYIRGLIIFIFIEGSITIDLLMGYCIPYFLLAIMLINSCKIQSEQDISIEVI